MQIMLHFHRGLQKEERIRVEKARETQHKLDEEVFLNQSLLKLV